MFGIGGWELLVIAVVALLVLGPKGLPSAARALGRVAQQLRRATQELRDTLELDPELSELPRTLDEINRPILTHAPRSYRKRQTTPKDQPPEDELPPVKAGQNEPRPAEPDGGAGDETEARGEGSARPAQGPPSEGETSDRAENDEPRSESSPSGPEPETTKGTGKPLWSPETSTSGEG